ncbi:hypothetical protein [Acinetobacter chinensis]|jgi:hypothetical protein|uniref:hypothetical protein n=1 Tax=Acinetobacter chinensis TaxID=2004650 RepID=UPI002934801D|nr:hypothetical protein [Acinetobacter chinensis]WOE41951.1 hypothetical protein QSG87_02025 [Acinetobacter chinensis]
MDKHIIFEDEHIRAIYLQGNSDTLVLSFGDLITRAKGLSINAEKSLMKYDYAVVGIMPKQKSWFPASSISALMEHLSPILSQFKNIVGYGGSMGGYAAIKYARVLKMNRVVAMVPQYSINPAEVDDKRYTDFYDETLNADMRIQAQDIVSDCEYIIVYDPYFENDKEHYLKIKPLIPQLHTLHLPYTGHDAIAVLANSALLHDFIEHPYDQTYFYKQIREVKKNSKFYYRSVIAHLLGTHNEALGKILKGTDIQLDSNFFDASLKQTITRILLTNKRVDEQDLQKLGIQVNFAFEDRMQLKDSFGNILVFNVITQKLESYDQQVIDVNGKYIIPLHVENSGLAQVEIKKQNYLICMNDRRVTKLFKQDDALSLDMNPIVIKKTTDFYVLSYKNFYMSCDIQGLVSFDDESLNEFCHFKIA